MFTCIKNIPSLAVLITIVLVFASPAFADKTDEIVNLGLSRNKSAAISQSKIDKLFDQTEKIVAESKQQEKVVTGLKLHNDRLRKSIEAQQEAINKLRFSIEEASLIERQIVPLMLQMISGLERFVSADLPFKYAERKQRIERIKGYLSNTNISAAERLRQVLEAFSTESDYGRTIDVYPETLTVDGNTLEVNILQIGRTVLYYQTADGKNSGIFDKETRSWKALPAKHNDGISRAMRVARKKIAPELMLLPLPAPESI